MNANLSKALQSRYSCDDFSIPPKEHKSKHHHKFSSLSSGSNSSTGSTSHHQEKKNCLESLLCLTYLRPYFNITSLDVFKRLLFSLIPFNVKFYDISTDHPDLYGPFWIYTFLIFIISASGSLSRYFQGNKVLNFFETFVPVAAAVIYGMGFITPLIMVIIMKCFGADNSYVSAVCIYGYSYTVFIPVIFICASGFNVAQWILLAYAVGHSSSFIIVNYWREMGKYVDKMRIIITCLIISCQVGLFFVLKLYFFEKFEAEIIKNMEDIVNENK